MLMVRSFLQSFFIIICACFLVSSVFANRSTDKVWQEIDESAIKRPEAERTAVPSEYKVFRANKTNLNSILEKAPAEFGSAARDGGDIIMTLPMPDGTFSRFKIQYSPIMEAGLAAKYPEIKSYIAQDIDNPRSTARISMSPSGFRAIIFAGYRTVLVDPYAQDDSSNYISYDKAMLTNDGNFSCLVSGETLNFGTERNDFFDFNSSPNPVSNGSTLRVYRLALAATAEYTNVFRQPEDTDAQAKARALEQQVITMTRVNGIYERDLAIRMMLVAGNDSIIYTDRDTDPYTNNNGFTMLGQNQTAIDREILPPNYEIGHVFSTGGGGVASISVPCNDASKARGVTGLLNPRGDAFAIDYVAHEMGHQWGAGHTFNGETGNCSDGNRFSISAYEPGSGVTVMGYAGICSSQDLARNSIDTFHIKSIEEILNYVAGNGSCSINVLTGNAVPTVTSVGGNAFNIPKDTPFALTATATDANGDSITYDWQQYDLGSATTSAPNTDSDGTARPIFRSYSPTASGTRYFPSLQYILNNANVPPPSYDCGRSTPCLTGELLPAITRTMKFQAIARDNRPHNGALSSTMVQVNVDGGSGPFQVTAPNTAVTWLANSNQTITWNAANTTNAPVSAANVRILLSTDGGQTFATTLSASTPNDGSQTVSIPNTSTTRARIKVEAAGNVFFDISNANFTISSTVAPSPKLFDFDGDGRSDVSVFRPSNGSWYLLRSQAGFAANQFGIGTDKTVAADYDGDGKTDIAVFRDGGWYWLNSSNGTFSAASFGQTGDAPIPGDFDGDDKNDLTVFRDGVWYTNQTTNNQVRITQFGQTGDKPLPGDYDGDGKADLAVYRGGSWYILGSTKGFIAVSFGIATDKPVPADYDGDGKTDFAVFRNGIWYLLQSNAGFAGLQFGISTDIPTAGDFDGDGKSDISVFRNGSWYLLGSQSGFAAVSFGTVNDIPITAQSN